MKAAQMSEYGSVNVIQLVDIEVPVAGDGQVVIEAYASSINPIETIVREGHMKLASLPATLGGDIAGVITEVGAGVSAFAAGDKVYGQASALGGNSGAFAEFAATAAAQIAKMPVNVSFEEAASLPLVGVSALQALTQHIGLHEDQKLFIHGGAGGIGSIAIQIAKNIGAYVATTATGDGVDFVRGLGADEVIDYKTQQFADVLADYDAVFDTVGGEDTTKAVAVLKQGGILVSMVAEADPTAVAGRGVTAIRQLTHVTTEMLTWLAALIESDVVTPQVDATYPLDQIKEAFTARESGAVRGKVVVKIKE
jgi:NADPH:quinone reductase-like Zn-dependent oxidoreductase